jgi:hypothetical protein
VPGLLDVGHSAGGGRGGGGTPPPLHTARQGDWGLRVRLPIRAAGHIHIGPLLGGFGVGLAPGCTRLRPRKDGQALVTGLQQAHHRDADGRGEVHTRFGVGGGTPAAGG